MLWWYLKGRLAGVFLELWLKTISLELWPRIEGKHVHSMSLEWHLLSCGTGWRMNTRNPWVVAQIGECWWCECTSCGSYRWVQKDFPPQSLGDEFGSLGTLQTMFHIWNSTWRYRVWSVAGFSHVFYKCWLIGVATRHLVVSSKDIVHGWHDGGHVVWNQRIWVSFDMCMCAYILTLIYMYVYMLAHPICLCLAMIM